MKDSPDGMPLVLIDNTADPLATVVTVSFGDVLVSSHTCESLRRLGLNINRAEVTEGSPTNTFYITDAATSEKIVKSDMIEQIRLTIINNMLAYHPEAAEFLVEGQHIDLPGDHEADEKILGARVQPLVRTRVEVRRRIGEVQDHHHHHRSAGAPGGHRAHAQGSLAQRRSAEIDTVGPKAFDIVYCTYRVSVSTRAWKNSSSTP